MQAQRPSAVDRGRASEKRDTKREGYKKHIGKRRFCFFMIIIHFIVKYDELKMRCRFFKLLLPFARTIIIIDGIDAVFRLIGTGTGKYWFENDWRIKRELIEGDDQVITGGCNAPMMTPFSGHQFLNHKSTLSRLSSLWFLLALLDRSSDSISRKYNFVLPTDWFLLLLFRLILGEKKAIIAVCCCFSFADNYLFCDRWLLLGDLMYWWWSRKSWISKRLLENFRFYFGFFWILGLLSFMFHSDEIYIENELIIEFLFFISDTVMMRCVGPTGKYPEAKLQSNLRGADNRQLIDKITAFVRNSISHSIFDSSSDRWKTKKKSNVFCFALVYYCILFGISFSLERSTVR